MGIGKILGLCVLFWLGASAVLIVHTLMEAPGGIAEASATFAGMDWAEIFSRGFFYGALALGVYNIYYRRKRMQEEEKS